MFKKIAQLVQQGFPIGWQGFNRHAIIIDITIFRDAEGVCNRCECDVTIFIIIMFSIIIIIGITIFRDAEGVCNRCECDIRDYGKKISKMECSFEETMEALQKANTSLEEVIHNHDDLINVIGPMKSIFKLRRMFNIKTKKTNSQPWAEG